MLRPPSPSGDEALRRVAAWPGVGSALGSGFGSGWGWGVGVGDRLRGLEFGVWVALAVALPGRP